MCDTEDVDQPARQPTWEGPAENIYTNVAAINGGPFDVTIIFGMQHQEAAADPTAEAAVREVARVSMSWGHAKALIPLLAKVVADYETKFGAVPSPGFGDYWKRD